MSKPLLADKALVIEGATYSGGRWIISFDSPIRFSASVADSGIEDSPFVKVKVDWGDSNIDLENRVVTGRDHQFFHFYEAIGEYVIKVWAINADGEVSDLSPLHTVLLYITRGAERKQPLARWFGPVLKREKLGFLLESEQPPARSYPLSGRYGKGSTTVTLQTNDNVDVGSKFTITQPGKLITSGVVISTDLNTITLDSALNDDYTNAAIIDIIDPNRGATYVSAKTSVATGFKVGRDEELVKLALMVLMSTRKGECVMRRSRGSRLHELPFEQNDVVTRQKAFNYTVDSVAEEPRIKIRSVHYGGSGHDITVKVVYSMRGAEEELFEAVIPLSQSDPTNTF